MKKSNSSYIPLVLTSLFLLAAITVAIVSIKEARGKEKQTISQSLTGVNIMKTPLPKPTNKLDLGNWKLTLPVGSSDNPTEITQPKLDSFEYNPWFVATSETNTLKFRAAVNGVTTSGSDYPRSELREMINNKTKASWSSESGVHSMYIDQAIMAVPNTKKDVVAGQIHDDEKDIIVTRLDYPVLHIRVDGTNVHTLDPDYVLGRRFNIKFVVEDNQTKVYYNNGTEPVYILSKDYSEAYFKAGVYPQSNCEKEKAKSLCNSDNYGEVVIYNIEVKHQ